MEVKRAVSKYFNAAQIESLPLDLSAPRFEPSEPSSEARRIRYERCRAATAIWDAANTRAGRLQALKNYQAENTLADTTVAKLMGPFLYKASNRLPLNEIEDALKKLGLLQRAQHCFVSTRKRQTGPGGISQFRTTLERRTTCADASSL